MTVEKLACPICHSKYTLEEAVVTGAMRELVDLAAEFGPVWKLVEEYTECFRRSQWAGVTFKKKLRLTKEMAALWRTNKFQFEGKRYRADRVAIRAALEVTCNMEKFGFTDHNYLKRVMTNNGAQRLSAEGLTAGEERLKEEGRRRKGKKSDESQVTSDEFVTAAEHKRRHKIKDLAGSIGKEMP